MRLCSTIASVDLNIGLHMIAVLQTIGKHQIECMHTNILPPDTGIHSNNKEKIELKQTPTAAKQGEALSI